MAHAQGRVDLVAAPDLFRNRAAAPPLSPLTRLTGRRIRDRTAVQGLGGSAPIDCPHSGSTWKQRDMSRLSLLSFDA